MNEICPRTILLITYYTNNYNLFPRPPKPLLYPGLRNHCKHNPEREILATSGHNHHDVSPCRNVSSYHHMHCK